MIVEVGVLVHLVVSVALSSGGIVDAVAKGVEGLTQFVGHRLVVVVAAAWVVRL